jgi:hypothetical protein
MKKPQPQPSHHCTTPNTLKTLTHNHNTNLAPLINKSNQTTQLIILQLHTAKHFIPWAGGRESEGNEELPKAEPV